MKKKQVKLPPKSTIDLKCHKCGRVTRHYLNPKTGEYRCVICQSVNKVVKINPSKDIVFEMDQELEDALNSITE